ncbi:hypothetical protein KEM09_21620 [Carboxylicivirga mesophila]|uniref:Uncharacterized protein n=1 Tax=Carboxylicivirga mesophila TaxID=1166478 RepID=A0ABS5KH17_9BACT|nr:hypothetical protein [Carboxylicivirga mesophila]MBS2214022.1 hypothetical protein [Carboxylicivirga mesophila]
MLELRNFMLGACGTLGILEVTNSEALLPTESEPEVLVVKALITLLVGGLSTVVTRVIRQRQDRQKRKTPTRRRKQVSKSQTIKN